MRNLHLLRDVDSAWPGKRGKCVTQDMERIHSKFLVPNIILYYHVISIYRLLKCSFSFPAYLFSHVVKTNAVWQYSGRLISELMIE